MKHIALKLSLIFVLFIAPVHKSSSQPVIEDFRKGTISEQLNQLEDRTRIYENFRAIREDIFQQVVKNINDTLASTNKKTNSYKEQIAALNNRIDSINKALEATKTSFQEIEETKNSISVLGININKTVYNTVMWSIIGVALLLLIIGYFIFKKNLETTSRSKTELADLQKEFEDYKQKKRIEIETMTMNHFNDMKKLKGEYLSR